mmetsp:Transcript_30610/g.52272  ORF Transcript_30610/g.52272 Transcript_30610/m.52272 type:complete len:304 (-) Transcript_30610:167-1078(-)
MQIRREQRRHEHGARPHHADPPRGINARLHDHAIVFQLTQRRHEGEEAGEDVVSGVDPAGHDESHGGAEEDGAPSLLFLWFFHGGGGGCFGGWCGGVDERLGEFRFVRYRCCRCGDWWGDQSALLVNYGQARSFRSRSSSSGGSSNSRVFNRHQFFRHIRQRDNPLIHRNPPHLILIQLGQHQIATLLHPLLHRRIQIGKHIAFLARTPRRAGHGLDVKHGIPRSLSGEYASLVHVGFAPETIEVVDVKMVGLGENVMGLLFFFLGFLLLYGSVEERASGGACCGLPSLLQWIVIRFILISCS